MQFAFVLSLLSAVASATGISLEINLIGLTPKGDLMAWHEKGTSSAGENERYVIAKTMGLSPTDIFTVSDSQTAAVIMDKSEMVRKARMKIKSLGIKSGRGTQEINDIYGDYRQLAFTARLYLKISPSRQEYNLEVYDEMSGRTRIIGSDRIPTDDPNITGVFRIKQARLSRDRSTCAVVVEQIYELNGRHKVDKLYTFIVFAAPPPEMPPPGGLSPARWSMRTVLIVATLAISAFGTVNEMGAQDLLGLSPDGMLFAVLYKVWDDGPASECSYSIKVCQTDSMQLEKYLPLGYLSPGMDEKNIDDPDFAAKLARARDVLTDLEITEGIKPKPILENGTEYYRVNSTLRLDFTSDYPRQTYSLQFHDGSLSVRGKGHVERNDVDEAQWNKYSPRTVQFSQDLSHCVVVVRHYNGHGGCYQKDMLYSFKTTNPIKGE